MKTKLMMVALLFSLLSIQTVYAEHEHINVQLKWTHDFQFSGFYMALEKGYYQDLGLDVTLFEGGPNKVSVDSVLSHANTYGISSTGAMLEQSKGKPIQAVGVIFQYSPLVLMVREDSGITKLEDLRGKRIMLQQGYQNAGIIAALQKVGVTQNDFIRQDISYNLNDLIDGKTDAYAVYAVNQPATLDAKGVAYRIFDPKDQGIEFYGDIVIVTDDEVKNHAERVRAFMNATSRGWQYAFEHVDETIALILRQYNSQNLTRKHLQFEASEMLNFVLPNIVKPGYMNILRWQRIAHVYQEQGFLPENYQVENFVYSPNYAWSDFLETYLWQILFSLMLLISIVLGASAFTLGRLVKRKTQIVVENEANYRTLLEMLDVGVVVHRDSGILYVNPYAIQCFQLGSLESAYGKDIMCYVHPDEHEAVMKRLHDLASSGFGHSRIQARYIGGKGKEIEAETYSMPFKFHGDPAVLTIIQDVTERNRKATEQKIMQKKMGQVQRLESLGVLAGGIAHDFNNLLAVILGHASLSLYKVDSQPNDVRKSLNEITKASESAAVLCQQMLAYSGKGKFIVEEVNLAKTVEKFRELMPFSVGKNVKVTYQMNNEVSLVQADVSQLHQVMMNLVFNASEAMENQGGLVAICVDEVDVDETYLTQCHHDQAEIGSYVYIEVKDEGCGMDARVKEKIFEPFFTTKFIGRGLGMSAVLGISRGHHGVIHIESKLNQGTTIRVLFPRLEKNLKVVSHMVESSE